jgi:integrase family protein with SAM-like domain
MLRVKLVRGKLTRRLTPSSTTRSTRPTFSIRRSSASGGRQNLRELGRAGFENLPAIIGRAGDAAAWRFVEFFAATIRNKNTRAAYARAIAQFFEWCDERRVRTLREINPVLIAAYIEHHPGSAPSVKQHLAAIRMLFDFLVTGQIVPMNPAASVHSAKLPHLRSKRVSATGKP